MQKRLTLDVDRGVVVESVFGARSEISIKLRQNIPQKSKKVRSSLRKLLYGKQNIGSAGYRQKTYIKVFPGKYGQSQQGSHGISQHGWAVDPFEDLLAGAASQSSDFTMKGRLILLLLVRPITERWLVLPLTACWVRGVHTCVNPRISYIPDVYTSRGIGSAFQV